MITYRKLSLATKRVAAASVLALSVGAGAGVILGATSTASAAPRSIKLIGTFSSHPDAAGCTSATGLCIAGHFEGLLNGTARLSVNSFAPTAYPGVALADATVVIHDIHGDVNCEEEATLNTAPGSDSEFGFVCEVTSGTGRYAGATGHVDAFGSMSPGASDWTGIFGGRITLAP